MKRIFKYLLVILIAIQIIYVAAGIRANPYATGDAYAIWYLKTKAFNQSLFDPSLSYSHPEYPVLYPLVLSLISSNWHVYLWLGPIIFIAVILVSYLYAGLPAAFAVSSVMILERLGGRGEVGFADWPLSLMYLICFYFAVKRKTNPLLLGILWGLTANLKMEGLIGAILFCFIFRPKDQRFYIPFIPLAFWWPITAAGLGLKTIYQNSVFRIWERIPTVIRLAAGSILDWRRFGLWPVIAIVTTRGKEAKWVALYLILMATTYLVTPLEISKHWETSFYRIMAQVLPLTICLIFNEVRKRHNIQSLFW